MRDRAAAGLIRPPEQGESQMEQIKRMARVLTALSQQLTWEELSPAVQDAVRELGIWPSNWIEHEYEYETLMDDMRANGFHELHPAEG